MNNPLSSPPIADPDSRTDQGGGPPDAPRPRLWRKVFTIVGATVGAVLIVAGGIAYWALDRFVIDHVEISDVAAYEAEVRGTGTSLGQAATGATTSSEASTSVAAATTAPAATTAMTTESTTAADDAAGAAPVITETSSVSDSTSISISTVVTGTGDDTVTYYVADVVVDDATQLRAGFAENKFGTNIIADTSDIAADVGAMFAINGDYYGFRQSGIVIRNGVLFRDDGARTGLAMYADGTMKVYDETTTSGEELLAAGVWNTLSFGPALVDGGEIVEGIEEVEIDTNIGNHSVQGNQPRTGLGVIDANHFVFVVVDGRSRGYSRGVTMTGFAEIFQDLGATVAYNLDGGGSSTMYFNGELVNNPLGRGKERGTSDILYIA